MFENCYDRQFHGEHKRRNDKDEKKHGQALENDFIGNYTYLYHKNFTFMDKETPVINKSKIYATKPYFMFVESPKELLNYLDTINKGDDSVKPKQFQPSSVAL